MEIQPTQKKEKKASSLIWIIIAAVLLLGVGALGYLWYQQKTKADTAIAQRNTYKHTADSLKAEYQKLYAEFDSIKVNNAELQAKIEQIKTELLAAQQSLEQEKKFGDAAQLRHYKSLYNQLKQEKENLLAQIAQLQAEKQTLQQEKARLTTDLNTEKTKNYQLTQENQVLTDKVIKGSRLSAFQIFADAVKLKGGGKKEKIVTKAKQADKVKIAYSITKNLIAEPGLKNAFIRIIAPDDRVLAEGIDSLNSFTSVDGQSLLYSTKYDFQYGNQEQDLTVYFTPKEELKEGRYKIEIYTDNALIGTSELILK